MRRLALLTALLLVAAACGGTRDGGPDAGAAAATPPDGTWVLVDAEPGTITIPDGTRATLRLASADGRTLDAGGDTPCNGFGGRATSDADGGWSWQLGAVTEMGCDEPRQAAQDDYLAALAATTSWSLDGDQLVLAGDAVALRFALQQPAQAAALVGTDWVLVGFLSGTGGDTAVSQMSWDAEDARLRLDGDGSGGTFTMFSGCRDFDGEWVVDGDTVRWPTWGQSADSREVEDCTDAERESESLVLPAFEAGFTAEVEAQEQRTFLTVRSVDDASVGLLFGSTEQDGGSSGEAVAEPPPATTGEELCTDATFDLADGEASPFDTAEAALRDLEENGDVGLLAALSLDETSIVLDGEVVGQVTVAAVPAGGFTIAGYSYCYPADRDLTSP